MEKLFLFCVLLSVFLTSCDEGFEPKTDIQEKYVLYGVVVASDNKVTLQRSIGLKEVKVSRVFNIDSYDITKFSFDPVVNATVTASCDGTSGKLSLIEVKKRPGRLLHPRSEFGCKHKIFGFGQGSNAKRENYIRADLFVRLELYYKGLSFL